MSRLLVPQYICARQLREHVRDVRVTSILGIFTSGGQVRVKIFSDGKASVLHFRMRVAKISA